MRVPDFESFGVDGYRARRVREGRRVRLRQRTWLGALTLGWLAAVLGAFALGPVVVRGSEALTPARGLGGVVALGLALGAVACGLYREEVELDFGARRFVVKKGFLWNVEERRGTFDDVAAVTVLRSEVSSGGRRRRSAHYHVGMRSGREDLRVHLWLASSRPQAERVAGTLAEAFGCGVEWEDSAARRGLERLANRLGRGRRSGAGR